MTVDERFCQALRRCSPFASLDDTSVTSVLGAMRRIALEPGQVLFREGDSGQSVFMVASGRIKLGRVSASAREMMVAALIPGQMFGELSVFDAGPRTMTATAVGDAIVLELSAPSLERLYETYPAIRTGMLRALARRLRDADDMLADLVFLDTAARVAKVLLELAAQCGRPAKGGVTVVRHGMTQMDLAHRVGSTRETVNKVLGVFAMRGWLRLDDRCVRITDPDSLRRRAGLGPLV
jgi:CRP-like cAMP-binding protein